MNASAPTRLDIVATIGLAIGGVFGVAGTFVGAAAVQQELWAMDAVGLIVATALLALKYFRKGDDCMAAGFLVFLAGGKLGGIEHCGWPVCQRPLVWRRHCAMVGSSS